MVFTTGAKIGFFGEYIYLCQDINLCEVKRTGLLIMTFLLLSLVGCRKYEQVQILSASVESLSISGLRAADLKLQVEVSNPAGKMQFEQVDGTVKHFGKVLGNVSLAPLQLQARTVEEYEVAARLTLDRGVSFKDLMNLMDIRRLKECTVDVSVTGKVSGVKIKREYKDLPLKKLLEDHNDEKI